MSDAAGTGPVKRKPNRRRKSSVTDALNQIPLNQAHQDHQKVAAETKTIIEGKATTAKAPSTTEVQPLSGPTKPRTKRSKDDLPDFYKTRGFWDDLKTGRWMLIPASSLKLMLIPVLLYANHALLVHFGLLGSSTPNPWARLLLLSNKLPNGKYSKTWWDLVFVAYYIIFWSFVRQIMTINVLRPLAKKLGIRGEKIMRFTEQGYAVFYMGILGSCGVWVMSGLPTWWYKTEEFWLGYPFKEITPELKAYYLLQGAYWMQQTIILAAKIEKPRKDFKELVAHHIVTLWLIGWSYNVYHTYIGVAVFVTMDVSDTFLALAKCVNYADESKSAPVFAFFVAVWTYCRHYLNIWILWSVWTQFDLIPARERIGFDPLNDQWMTWWMKYQIFVPIFILQLINLFWYFLIWRILIKALVGNDLKDERSDDEDDGGEEENDHVVDEAKRVEGEKTTTEKVKGA